MQWVHVLNRGLGLFFPPALIFHHLKSLLETREDPASLICKGGPLALEKYPTGREKNLKLGGTWPRERGRDSHLRGSPHPDVGLSPGPNCGLCPAGSESCPPAKAPTGMEEQASSVNVSNP